MEDYSGIMEAKLAMLRSLVAQPVTTEDPKPCVVGDSILVGNKFHVTQPALLSRLGVTAVLNCAPSGIRNLPLDDYEEMGIKYHFTNCARDDENYPILHNRDGVRSPHLGGRGAKGSLRCRGRGRRGINECRRRRRRHRHR